MKYYVGNSWRKRPVVYSTWHNDQLRPNLRTFTDTAISKAWTNQFTSTVDTTTVYKYRIKPKDQLW